MMSREKNFFCLKSLTTLRYPIWNPLALLRLEILETLETLSGKTIVTVSRVSRVSCFKGGGCLRGGS